MHTLQSWDNLDAPARRQFASACKIKAGQAGKYVAAQALQLHGGVGMTEEYPVSHVYKRMAVLDRQFGTRDFHLEEYAARSKQ